MATVRYTLRALQDLDRLRQFLQTQDPAVAQRAVQVIRAAVDKIGFMPERFRPVENQIHMREAIVDFGRSGYLVRFRHEPHSDVLVLRIRHQREDAF